MSDQDNGNHLASNLTVCYRARPSTLTEYETHVSVAGPDGNNDMLYLCEFVRLKEISSN